jgi:hypothetical protein
MRHAPTDRASAAPGSHPFFRKQGGNLGKRCACVSGRMAQNVHGARQPSVFQPYGMEWLGLGKRLCVCGLFVWSSTHV